MYTTIAIILALALAAIAIAGAVIAVLYRVVVPTNMVHIIQRSKSSTPYGRGQEAGNTYYKWPEWIPVIGLSVIEYPESIFKIELLDYDSYDAERLPFMVDITAFFRIEQAQKAAQRVENFNELRGHLINILQGAVRRILATNNLEDIMEARGKFGQEFTDEVTSQLAEWGVIPVKSIEFMDIRDMVGEKVIENIMEKEKSRIDMESRVRVAENKQEAESKEIEAQRNIDIQKEVALQQVGERAAEKDKAVGVAQQVAQQDIQVQAKITAEKDMAVIKVNEVQQANIDKEKAVVKAEEEKDVAILNADAEKESTIRVADGDFQSAQFDAKGIKEVGVAKGEAERALLQAPVTTQIELAKEIGSNEGYQTYLNSQAQIKVSGEVGVALAKAMESADLKVIANSNDPQAGVASLGDLFTAKGGTNVTGMLEALAQSETGQALVSKLVAPKVPEAPAEVKADVTVQPAAKPVAKPAAKPAPKKDGDSNSES